MLKGAPSSMGLIWLAVLASACLLLPWLPLEDPLQLDLGHALQGPTASHLAGTDPLGRDIFSRLLWAGRPTLLIVAGATSLDLLLAVVIGTLAAFRRGWLDRLVLLAIDLFWSIPFVVFVVLVVAVTGVSVFTLICTIAGINWVAATRIIRAEVLRLRSADFVRRARAFGFPKSAILLSEVGPNLLPLLLNLAAYTAIEVLTLETGLAFLGLSLPAPAPTWGGLLAEGLSYVQSAWWLAGSTAIVITMTLTSLHLLAREIETNLD
jgi:peptide/nickel transport system permease protein